MARKDCQYKYVIATSLHMAVGQQLNEQFQETLVEKTLRHRWCNSDSTEYLYTGQIVPGTTDWFNVLYDGDVLSSNL